MTESASEADGKRLEHMIRSARDAQLIVGGDSVEVIAADMVRARAPVNCFTETGEAASRHSLEARDRIGDLR